MLVCLQRVGKTCSWTVNDIFCTLAYAKGHTLSILKFSSKVLMCGTKAKQVRQYLVADHVSPQTFGARDG